MARGSGIAQNSVPNAVLYLDHSASMRGFLQPLGGDPTSFQTVVDRILAGAQPERAFTYGSRLAPLNFNRSLAAINTPTFYSETNTLLEQALDSVGRDTAAGRTHILIGDGRRGSPAIANAQFTRMRSTAANWIAHGGTFVVAVSMAPFRTVPSDPSGCQQGPSASQVGQTCPLYAFMFVAPADVQEITSAASEVFQHIFVWPVPRLAASALATTRPPATPVININPRWVQLPNGQYVTRVRGVGDASNNAATIGLAVDATNLSGRVASAILEGEEVKVILRQKPLSEASASQQWTAVSPVGGLARVAPMSGEMLPGIAFITRGSGAPATIIVADVIPTGTPSWLSEFDAKDSADVVRTYGLSRLFTGFQFDASNKPRSIAQYTFVAN